MALIIEEGKVINGHIILSNPLSLAEGTEVRVQIEPIDPVSVNKDDAQNTDSNESEDFANQPFFGMWADREEMRDSVAWVRKQRGKMEGTTYTNGIMENIFLRWWGCGAFDACFGDVNIAFGSVSVQSEFSGCRNRYTIISLFPTNTSTTAIP